MSGETRKVKIGGGHNILNRHERTFPRGALMFIEGELSTEMYIIRSGCVRVLKQEGENTIELARLGPGSVLGELSLLDHQPRGATAQVVEDTTVTIIDEELFRRTLDSIPEWLENMIRLVVKRHRDTMKKIGHDIVTRSIGGVIRIMLLLSERKGAAGEICPPVITLRERVYVIIGIGGVEFENVLLHLILKKLIVVRKNDAGQEQVVILDRPALLLYMQFLRMHQRGGALIGESFTASAFELIDVIISALERDGREPGDKPVQIGKQAVELEFERRGASGFVDLDALDQLTTSKLLSIRRESTETKHGRHRSENWLVNPDILRNVALLKTWLPVFREEVTF